VNTAGQKEKGVVMKKKWFMLVLVSALLGFTPLAWPAVYYVTPTSDSDCSDFNYDFQSTLNAASANDDGVSRDKDI
jgi:hypothetical protein